MQISFTFSVTILHQGTIAATQFLQGQNQLENSQLIRFFEYHFVLPFRVEKTLEMLKNTVRTKKCLTIVEQGSYFKMRVVEVFRPYLKEVLG